MSRRQRIDCPHERRPGMAVCLHCLHAARLEARERRQRAIVRFAVWTFSIAIVGVVGAAGVNAATKHPDQTTPRTAKRSQGQVIAAKSPPRTDSAVVTVASAIVQQGMPAVGAAAAQTLDSSTAATASQAPVAPVPAGQPPAVSAQRPARAASVADSSPRLVIGPIIPQGRTDLRDSLFAIRSADTVVVHFDTSPARTRRADKFEAIVRETLNIVYGPIADSLLSAVPSGRLAAPNELVTTLPSRGIHLAGPHGARLVLWPETRPGRDGPLVVAYRTIVER